MTRETETFAVGDAVCVNLTGATLVPKPGMIMTGLFTSGLSEWHPGTVHEIRPADHYIVRLDSRTEAGEPTDLLAPAGGLRRRQPGESCE